tara:strand:- start:635 stop:1081 length:447 start_codon:yes stop_codon:yes gene_type:complete
MAFTGNYMCTSFKVALLNGEMDFSSDTSQAFKIALYTSDATLTADTTVYSVTDEASGTGYTAGGNTLTIATNPTSDTATSGTVAYLDFSDSSWTSSSITARGALIYKAGGTTPAVAILDFGSEKTSSDSAFTITFPTSGATTAIVRVG